MYWSVEEVKTQEIKFVYQLNEQFETKTQRKFTTF
jgi:hypothetical protein